MNSKLLVFLGLTAILGTATASLFGKASSTSDMETEATANLFGKASSTSDMETDPALRMLAFETAVNQAILALPRNRARRAAARHCGSKLITFVVSTCGDACAPEEAADIASNCCQQSCDVDYVKSVCCPHH